MIKEKSCTIHSHPRQIRLSACQLRADTRAPAKTRFKTWWSLVGSAIENAAGALVDDQLPIAAEDRYASEIDFAKLFALVEEEDEDGTEMSQVLDILHFTFKSGSFQASDVAERINSPMDGEAQVATTLRGFFEPSGRRSLADISPRVIGRRLGAMTGAPLFVGDRTLRLDRFVPKNQSKQRKVQLFTIRVL